MRGSAWLLVLAGCTAANPEFGAGLARSDTGDASGSSSVGASSSDGVVDTGIDVSSSDGGTVSACEPPDDEIPFVHLDQMIAGTSTHGAIQLTGDGLIAVDCTAPCAIDVVGGCQPVEFEIWPPLWGGWEPPGGCFRFQWASNDLEVIDELRIGGEGQPDALTILGGAPLAANAFDVEVEPSERCECADARCCPPDAGEYEIVVHGDEDLWLREGDTEEEVAWMKGVYRVENVASSLVPDCEAPVRMQFRAYRRD
ncbi:MAG: hypothetical protein IAG13_28925 [Deltaproteobacteria bacterium]|nr:hypothetical protein [Nannocystaceae bacterium]